MKLLTYDTGAGPRCGVLQGDAVLDVTALLGETTPLRDVAALLQLPGDGIERVRQRLAVGNVPHGVPLAGQALRSPVLQPPTVRDFFAFEGHASAGGTRTLSAAWYRLPIFYFSNTLRIFGPDELVPFPSASRMFDYELEIGCVIGKEGANVRPEDALSHIAGFTIFNDWSCRDLQRDEMAATLGPAKGKDSATTLGPWLVTTDELLPYLKDGRLAVGCTLSVNGVQWMQGEGSLMHHTWQNFVVRASRDSRIVPGDVFGSGTVTGGTIGEAIRNGYPARWLEPGDTVEISVEGIGTLRSVLGPKPRLEAWYGYAAPGDIQWG